MSEQPYHEHLLHWIWKTRNFNMRHLQTTDGDTLRIYNPGISNQSDGPDFLNAKIQIDKLYWHGDVELHWKEDDWKKHGHHHNSNFDRVILHVVYEFPETHSAFRSDQSSIPTLCLAPYLSHPLQHFLSHFRTTDILPCQPHANNISGEIFAKQIDKAHQEYFEQKINDQLVFFNPSLPLEKAWKNMIIIALFDGLGISHNRKPMRWLAKKLIKNQPIFQTPEECLEFACKEARLTGPEQPTIPRWKHKGSRPGNHPKKRVPQGAEIFWLINDMTFSKFMKKDPALLWKKLFAQFSVSKPPGNQRRSILFGTVWLPGLYILGNLLHSNARKHTARKHWKNHRANLPKSLLKPLLNLPIPEKIYRKKLGSIQQLRRYCTPRNCQDCKVFKSIISS